MASRGRPQKITPEMWLDAVYKIHTTSDKDIASELKVHRTTIMRLEIPDEIKQKANEYIIELSQLEYTRDLQKYEIFLKIPIIEEWSRILKDNRRVSPSVHDQNIRTFFNVCRHLKIHPAKIDVETCAKLNNEHKKLYWEDREKEIPRGLAYTTLRASLRSFFILMHNYSGEYLSSLGITKETLKGAGKYAKQKVSKEVRHNFEKTLWNYSDNESEYLELLYCAKFMYYTGTRIMATITFNLEKQSWEFNNNEMIFEVIDKGEHKKGRLKWDKILIDFAKEDFEEYIKKRFNLDDIKLLARKTRYLFPSFRTHKGYARLSEIYKKALDDAGIPYKDYPQCHIFRHTFAQDGLNATNHNYELVASLGGWESTWILKKHYGKMGKHQKIKGLKQAMGIEEKEEGEKIILRW